MAEAPDDLSVSVDVRRKVLYASLLRHESAAGSLRDRALDRLVLSGLSGTTEASPLRIGALQARISLGSEVPSVRVETIQTTLDRLIGAELVRRTETRKRHAYFLTSRGIAAIGETIETGEKMVDAALDRMLVDTGMLVPAETARCVCRDFLSEAFARFGRQIAKAVIGQWSRDDLVRLADVKAAFNAAAKGHALSAPQRETLESRCVAFLRSSHPDDEQLKFKLTQGYYFAQLLGLEGGVFDPLAEQAFAGSVFYVDTNVLLPRVLGVGINAARFDEALHVATKLGVELRVTRATVDEARRVAADRLRQMNSIVGVVPDAVIKEIADPFFESFLEARSKTPGLTPAVFMERFDRLPSLINDELKSVFEDIVEDEMIANRDLSRTITVIQEEAERSRGARKSMFAATHDGAHLLWVTDKRNENAKTWFLTRDRTLAQAAARLKSPGQLDFTFSLLAFLQSISPYTASAAIEFSFADVFSSFLSEQVLPREGLFDIQELAVLAEMHEDVFATPPEKLIEAWDFVKHTVLQGRPLEPADGPKFALTLKKYLASSSDDQKRALEGETMRLAAEAEKSKGRTEDERRAREAAEKDAAVLREETDSLRRELSEVRASESVLRKDVAAVTRSLHQRARNEALRRSFFGVATAFLLVVFGNTLANSMTSRVITDFPSFGASVQTYAEAVIGWLALAFALVPTALYIRLVKWREELKIAVLAAYSVLAVIGCRIIIGVDTPIVADVLAITTIVATIIVLWRRTDSQARQ